MKIGNGNWLIKDGLNLLYPGFVYSYDFDGEKLTVFASTKESIENRANQINGPLFTLEITSPLSGIISVKSVHFAGTVDDAPNFELNKEKVDVSFNDTEDFIEYISGSLTLRIGKKAWSFEFLRQGKKITGCEYKNLGYVTDTNDNKRYMYSRLDMSVGEYVYGLGERFTSFVKNGQTVDEWNLDGGTSTEQAYKNIPFYVTNKGYGVFVNSTDLVSFEVGSERVSKVQFSVEGESLEYMVIDGPTPKEVLNKYTALTGRPALPPTWSFGLWLTTSFTTNYDEKTVNSFIDGMAKRDLPLHVFHFDCFWMKGFEWCNFTWDESFFPDPKAMLQRLHTDKKLKICVWINSYVGQKSPLFKEGMEKGYFLKRENGDVWQWDLWQAGQAIVDFTNPDACAWYKSKLKALVDMGVDCFKTDFGERIPTDCVYFNGKSAHKMHNYYTYLYNKLVFEVLEEKYGKGNAVLFARSATVGGQKFPAHWGGDCYATFESMAETLRGGLSLGMAGFGFWSHDIGGFETTAPAQVYKRWVAFGLLSSQSRLHGSTSYRVPWVYDDEACDVLRFFTKLKCSLMPYLYAKAKEAHETGCPILRAMALEFNSDRGCDTLDTQYMLGDKLLVAPIFNDEGEVDFYLPKGGKWTSLLHGNTLEGGQFVHEQHDFMSLPLYVRPNTLLAIGACDTKPDYDFSKGTTFKLFELGDGATAEAILTDDKGNTVYTLKAKRQGQEIEFTGIGTAYNLKVELVILKVKSSSNCNFNIEGNHTVLTAIKESFKVLIA